MRGDIPFSIVCFSPQEWATPLPTNRQQIMLRAARRGHPVLFVETGEFVGRHVARLVRGSARLSLLRRLAGTETVAPGLRVTKALNLLPWGQRFGLSDRINGTISGWIIGRRARSLSRPRVVWLYDPRATWAMHRTGEAFAVYDCVDDYAEQATGARNRALVAAADRRAAATSHLVFVTTSPLRDRHLALNPRTYLVRNAGDFAHFTRAVDRASAPDHLAALPRPVLGFAGNFVASKVDIALLEHLAAEAPGTLLLAGPAEGAMRARLDALVGRQNVVWVGPVPYDELPRVVAAFDVGLIPYVANEYTRSVFPLKLFEYLAAGKPIVATGLSELHGMEPDVVVAEGAREAVSAVEAALRISEPADVERRRAIAERNSWETRAARLLGLVAEELEL